MEPLTITTLVVTILGLVLGLFQSIRSNHFKSDCCNLCTVENDYQGKTSD